MPSNAIVYTKSNKLEFLPIVSAPLSEHEIRVRTIATSISAGIERFLLTGKSITRKELKFPVVPGSECIGEVIEVGSAVTSVELGEYVYAWKSEKWEEVQSVFGCQAESVMVREGDFLPLRRLPEESDVLIGLLADALSAVHKLDLEHTERILILGLGALGLTIAEVLHYYNFTAVDACEMFIQRGDLAKRATLPSTFPTSLPTTTTATMSLSSARVGFCSLNLRFGFSNHKANFCSQAITMS